MKFAVIGQSGGPTSAINATLAGVISGCLCEGFDKIYGMRNGVEGFLNEEFIDLKEYFDSPACDALDALSHTPAAALGSCRKKINSDEICERMFEIFEKHSINYFFYIGGNDSMDAVSKLTDYAKRHGKNGVHFIGVPKTIDNDLVLTDHTPGFGSAAKYIATSCQELVRDCAVYKVPAVTIIEIMGRDAGWLTTSSALSKEICGEGVDLIYLPEAAFNKDKFIDDINGLLTSGDKPYVLVAVSEGIRDKDGKYVAEDAMSGAVDSFGHKYLAGTGKYLENLVRERIGCKVRSIELNLLQRCASHVASKTDIDESRLVGKSAVEFASLDGRSGVMAAFVRDGDYHVSVAPMDVCEIANKVKCVPREFINDEENGVTAECIKYLLPLIQGELDIKYENGIPVHFKF